MLEGAGMGGNGASHDLEWNLSNVFASLKGLDDALAELGSANSKSLDADTLEGNGDDL